MSDLSDTSDRRTMPLITIKTHNTLITITKRPVILLWNFRVLACYTLE
jgi:hypothetical protein